MSALDLDFVRDKKIGVFAPSSFIDKERLQSGLDIIHAYGIETLVHEQCFARHNQSAGHNKDKMSALYDLASNDDIGLIMAAGGGNRALHMVADIDYANLAQFRKAYCGYSDSTVLLSSLSTKSNWPCFFGPMVQNLATLNKTDRDFFFGNLFTTAKQPYVFANETAIVKKGRAEGMIFGGTLSMLCALTGSDYLPHDLDGAILYIEDCFEELSRIDRALAHLSLVLPFSSLGGLIIGHFTDAQDNGRPFGFSFEDIIAEHAAKIDGPVIINAPVGHGERLQALPFGARAYLAANEQITLEF